MSSSKYWTAEWFTTFLRGLDATEMSAFESGAAGKVDIPPPATTSLSSSPEADGVHPSKEDPPAGATSESTIDPKEVEALIAKYKAAKGAGSGGKEQVNPETEFLSFMQKTGAVRLSKDKEGCRLMQEAIGNASPLCQEKVCEELSVKPAPFELAKHQYANFVIQELILTMSCRQAERFLNGLEDKDKDLAKLILHRFACRSAINLVDNEFGKEQISKVCLDNLMEHAKHNYGHHVVQKLMKHSDKFCEDVLKKFVEAPCDFLELIKLRNSSYVGEEAFRRASAEDKDTLIKNILEIETVKTLLTDGFGKFVLKVMLEQSPPHSKPAFELASNISKVADQDNNDKPNLIYQAARKFLGSVSAGSSGQGKSSGASSK